MMYPTFKADIMRLGVILTIVAAVIVIAYKSSEQKDPPRRQRALTNTAPSSPRPPSARRQQFGNFSLWWDDIPEFFFTNRVETGTRSNICTADYAGPETCQQCHQKNYDSWSQHPHRWMNALADPETVKGDFSGKQPIQYLGGEANFYQDGTTLLMELVREDITHIYEITQTIGSRFFQYYVGRLVKGPEPPSHPRYTDDHVLPFGYWLDRSEWIPIVHVHDREDLHTQAEEVLHDPFVEQPGLPGGDWGAYCDQTRDLYRSQCNFCHTTFPVGHMMVRDQKKVGNHIPATVHLSMADYVSSATPELWNPEREAWQMSDAEFAVILRKYRAFDAREEAVTLGVSCEACHLGSREHAENKAVKPAFFPTSPDLVIQSPNSQYDTGRTHDNVNWACGRCHVGTRPEFTSGVHTWNSTEYSDAMNGSCYSQLTCVDCHNPHEAIGPQWSRTADQDDAACLKCHQGLATEEARTAHTHHPSGTEGSRCMNCHMPRINEGLQDFVRTHTIHSPTLPAVIEHNEPNACNMCHVDKPIDWTVEHLKNWYDASFDESKLAQNYPNRDQATAAGWLQSGNRYVRQVATDALSRTNSTWALPQLLKSLDDVYLLNRQFARIGLERMLGIRLSDFGYRFYMTEEERQASLRKIEESVLAPDSFAQATAD